MPFRVVMRLQWVHLPTQVAKTFNSGIDSLASFRLTLLLAAAKVGWFAPSCSLLPWNKINSPLCLGEKVLSVVRYLSLSGGRQARLRA